MPSFCHDLKTCYEHLQKLTAEFTGMYSVAKESGDLREAKRLQKDLEGARDAFFDRVTLFIVPDAENPHHEALLNSGLLRTKTSKYEDRRVDIRKEIERQLGAYREVRNDMGSACLEEWVKDITEHKHLVYAEITKDRAKIMERIKAGMIPVVMPSRSVQERTWCEDLPHLKPSWVKDGNKEPVHEASLYYTGTDDTKAMTREGFFNNIPDQPYLVWVKPTQKPLPGPENKTFENQRAFHEALVRDHPNLYDPTDIIPTEYIALQAAYTASVHREFMERAGGGGQYVNIVPLDMGTRTRFFSATRFASGKLSMALFQRERHRLSFDFDDGEEDIWCGIRPVSRT